MPTAYPLQRLFRISQVIRLLDESIGSGHKRLILLCPVRYMAEQYRRCMRNAEAQARRKLPGDDACIVKACRLGLYPAV
jgi:hypothetical protein